MYPILLQWKFLTIHSFGALLAVSFAVGIILAEKRARRRGIGETVMSNLYMLVLIASVIGCRLAYVAFHLEEFRSVWDIFAVWKGGATLYGGLILSVLVGYPYLRRQGIPILVMGDILMPSVALGIGITRIGCFLSGCCFGKPTNLPWGIVFPASCPAGSYAQGAHLHPTQIYASLDGFILFGVLLLAERKARFDGFVFSFFLVGYGVARFVEDFFRYYELNMTTVGGLSLNQIMSLGLIALGVVLLVTRERKPLWHLSA